MTSPEPPALTGKQRDKLLDLIRQDPAVGTVAALKQVGLKASQPQARMIVVELGEAYEEARGRGKERIRAEIKRRAIDGVDEPVYQGGKQVGVIRHYSDRLLLALAKAELPEYRDRVELTGAAGEPIQLEVEHRPTGLSEVFQLAREFGIGLAAGAQERLGAGAAGRALPAAADVLPDPADG